MIVLKNALHNITYDISAPALKFLPPYRTMDDTVGSVTAFFKLSLRWFLIAFERGLRGLLHPDSAGGDIKITSTCVLFISVFQNVDFTAGDK